MQLKLAPFLALQLVALPSVEGSTAVFFTEVASKATTTSAGAAKAAVSLHQRASANNTADCAAGINAHCIDVSCVLAVLLIVGIIFDCLCVDEAASSLSDSS